MAAGGFGQPACMDQAQIARVIQIGKGRKRLMKAKVHIRHILGNHPPRRIALAQHAQIFGPRRDQVFIGRGANKAKPIGPTPQKQHHKDRFAHMCL